jgi:hypothetical protein
LSLLRGNAENRYIIAVSNYARTIAHSIGSIQNVQDRYRLNLTNGVPGCLHIGNPIIDCNIKLFLATKQRSAFRHGAVPTFVAVVSGAVLGAIAEIPDEGDVALRFNT